MMVWWASGSVVVMSVVLVIVGSMVLLVVILVIRTWGRGRRSVAVAGTAVIRTVIIAMFTVVEATTAKISRVCLREYSRNHFSCVQLVLQKVDRFASEWVKRTCGAVSVEVVKALRLNRFQ
jgi:hypothetical protein